MHINIANNIVFVNIQAVIQFGIICYPIGHLSGQSHGQEDSGKEFAVSWNQVNTFSIG